MTTTTDIQLGSRWERCTVQRDLTAARQTFIHGMDLWEAGELPRMVLLEWTFALSYLGAARARSSIIGDQLTIQFCDACLRVVHRTMLAYHEATAAGGAA